jgi:cytochrome bd-type quinol oxidase subunit 1
MHRFPSQSVIIRLRVAAFLMCIKWLLIPIALGVLIHSLIDREEQLTLTAFGLVCTAVLAGVFQWIFASRGRCPLCMTPVLINKRCSKHRNAKTLFGSYGLRAALAMIFKGCFRCPYCNEPSALQVRQRGN